MSKPLAEFQAEIVDVSAKLLQLTTHRQQLSERLAAATGADRVALQHDVDAIRNEFSATQTRLSRLIDELHATLDVEGSET